MRQCGKILYNGAGQYGALALLSGYLRLQTHTLRICNTHCFSTATMVARTRLNVTSYVHCLSCYNIRKVVENNSTNINLDARQQAVSENNA